MSQVMERAERTDFVSAAAGSTGIDLFLAAIRAQLGLGEAGLAASRLSPPPAPRVPGSPETAALHDRQDTLIHDARESFVAPLLYSWLTGAGATGRPLAPPSVPIAPPETRRLPPAELAALRPLYYANAARKAALLRLLEEVAGLFASRDIGFLLLKGAALETALDLPPALRVMADLDLLVPPEALPRAERALAEAGLTSSRDGANTRLLRRRGYHLAPYTAPTGAVVELHREVLPRGVPFSLPAAEVWRESRTLAWRGRELRVPSTEHLFLHAAIHSGFWHTRGVALRRIWDLGLIATRLMLDSSRLTALARCSGASKLVRTAEWELEALLRPDPSTWTELCGRLQAADDLWCPHDTRDRLRARVAALDSAGQRLKLLRFALLPPREETANATGCHSAAAHLAHFFHPRRLWRGLHPHRKVSADDVANG